MDKGKSQGKGKGKFKSKLSPEVIQHAVEVNVQRDNESLPRKSPGSIARAKARSAAFHAAKAAAAQNARDIGPPAVTPPPPPPPPSRGRREGGGQMRTRVLPQTLSLLSGVKLLPRSRKVKMKETWKRCLWKRPKLRKARWF